MLKIRKIKAKTIMKIRKSTKKLEGTRVFTSAIVMYKKKLLILRRGEKVKFNPRAWDSVGWHLKEYETAEENILREAKEETGLKIKILKSGRSYEIQDKYGRWIVIPFLCQANTYRVKLKPDEHSEYKWISPKETKNYNCVPDIKEDLKLFGLI